MDTFKQLVAEMRRNQKQYFATRAKGALIASKELEAKIDRILKSEGYATDKSN